MIHRFTITSKNGYYIVADDELQTPAVAESIANELWQEGIYNDAILYYRQANSSSKSVWSSCSSTRELWPDLPRKARSKMPDVKPGQTVVVYACLY